MLEQERSWQPRVVENAEEADELPKISAEELEEVCNLAVSDEEIAAAAELIKKHGAILLDLLAERNLSTELPVAEETFIYRRNLTECEQLKKSIYKIFGQKPKDWESVSEADMRAAAKLLVLEQRKAAWLEQNYFPAVFARTLVAARGEVNQFLIKQKNTAELERFRLTTEVPIHLLDEINYVTRGAPPGSVGSYNARGQEATISIPSYYTKTDEWKVYITAVHELVHHASHQQNYGDKIGLQLGSGTDVEQVELNEAVTQFVTFLIAEDHLKKAKTTLSQERNSKLSLFNMAYAEYTVILKNTFKKVPAQYFIDALLNYEGYTH